MHQSKIRLLTLTGAILAVSTVSMAVSKDKTPDENNPAFHDIVLKKAGEYKKYSLVDENLHRSPVLCDAPPVIAPKMSKSVDYSTHGKKVYWLYAKQISAYLANADAPVGQTLVKESFEPGQDYQEILKKTETAQSWLPFRTYVDNSAKPDPGKKYGLFIMTKLDPKTPGTDQGWVYATVSPDGKTVTSAGRAQSCMACHTTCKYDRQFGFERKP